MANLTTGFPRRTGDEVRDREEMYDWAVSLIDELKQLLNNLDSGNVLEAASVKAENIIDLENLVANRVQAQTIVTNTLISDSLYSDTGEIAELTVDRISTSKRLYKYLLGDTSPDVYFEGYEQGLYFCQGTVITNDEGVVLTEQMTDRYGNLVWWQKPYTQIINGVPYDENGDRVLTTRTQNTGLPCIVYKYNVLKKMQIAFWTDSAGTANPRISLGVGEEAGTEKGKAFIEKTAAGLEIKYITSDGEERTIHFKNGGIYQTRADGESALPFVYTSQTTPPDTMGREGDLCFVVIE